MTRQQIIFRDLGLMDYQQAWDYQEDLLRDNVQRKLRSSTLNGTGNRTDSTLSTRNYLLFVEHPPVYTLGKSGKQENVLLTEEQLQQRNIQFFHSNRGGDITFHGAGQIVAYPILDLEKFDTDIGWYLRQLEEVVILTLADYGIEAGRSPGETGVWLDAGLTGKERKICAIGVRCSRWITMHGFAFNINTDLSYFNHIIPCGIANKQVTSLEKELGRRVDLQEAKDRTRKNFEKVFNGELISEILL